jgi:hypothetical protein
MPYSTDPILYRTEQETRINSYYSSNRAKFAGFGGRDRFIDWYMHELYIQENKCHYCNTSILEIRRLINAGTINGRSVRGGGLRGPNFEVDRRDPFGVYEEANCVLSCYYCNNDKSNTFNYETYLNIIGPAKKQAWDLLLGKRDL